MYPQSMFLAKIRKNIEKILLKIFNFYNLKNLWACFRNVYYLLFFFFFFFFFFSRKIRKNGYELLDTMIKFNQHQENMFMKSIPS